MYRGHRTSIIRADIHRIATDKKAYLAFAAGLFLLLRPLFDILGYWHNYSPIELLSIPLGISDFSPFAAIFCVFPFSESFCEDINSGYYYSIVSRTGVKHYAMQRCFSVGLSGGIVVGAIMLATIGFCLIAVGINAPPDDYSFMDNTMWAQTGILQIWNGKLLYFIRVFVAFLFGYVWAMVGLTVSVLIPNRYVTLIAPFVLYQFLWFLMSESPFNPVYMFRGDSNFIPSFGFLLFYQCLIILLCSGISYFGIIKRVRI